MRTKILCTIGPSTESDEMIKKLIENGMSIARLNFSHDIREKHGERIDRVRKWAKKLNKHVEIFCDLQGPKIRVADFPNPPIKLNDGQKIILSSSACNEIKPNEIVIEDPYIHSDVNKGDIILIEDGQIELVVESVTNHKIHCKVIVGGDLYPKKGVNLPLTKTTTSSLTDKDYGDLEFILTKNPDWIAISFVQDKYDLEKIRQLIGKSKARIMSKIERATAVENLTELIEASDGITVARGDLGVEIPFEKLPVIQKQIIKRCNYAGKPVITATQMLATMTNAPVPTRAEVSDIANAIIDGTDGVWLSNETAIGKYPIEALTVMRKVVEATEDYWFNRQNRL